MSVIFIFIKPKDMEGEKGKDLVQNTPITIEMTIFGFDYFVFFDYHMICRAADGVITIV